MHPTMTEPTEMELRLTGLIEIMTRGELPRNTTGPEPMALLIARASIRMMYKPTEAMLAAWEQNGEESWHRGIDAASPAEKS